jgi:predicted CopG family antitoxin
VSDRTVSLREDVCRALEDERRPDESVPDVVERLVLEHEGDHPLYGLVGVLDEGTTDRVKAGSESVRESVDERMDRQS